MTVREHSNIASAGLEGGVSSKILAMPTLQWKTQFEGRLPLMEGNLRWKTAFFGRNITKQTHIRTKPHVGATFHHKMRVIGSNGRPIFGRMESKK